MYPTIPSSGELVEPETININKNEFVRRPFMMLDLISTGRVPFDDVMACSDSAFNTGLGRSSWPDKGWNFERFTIGKNGGILFRLERGGKVEEQYAGSYILLLRRAVFPYKITTQLGLTHTVGNVRQMFSSLDALMGSVQEPVWPFVEDREFGLTFANQEDAVMFSAMYAANDIAA